VLELDLSQADIAGGIRPKQPIRYQASAIGKSSLKDLSAFGLTDRPRNSSSSNRRGGCS
jgi:hypothetical protein